VIEVEHSSVESVDTFAVLGSNVIGMSSAIKDVYDSCSDGDTLTFNTTRKTPICTGW
jgi:hypothetical protein